MNTNFNILNKTKKIHEYINKLIVNFPKKEYILKNNIETSMYEMIRSIFSCNIQDSFRIREKYLKDFLIELSMLNYYMEISYQKKYISKRQSDVVGRAFIELRKMLYGVIRNESDSL